MFALGLVFICIFAGSIGQICFKTGMMRSTDQEIGTEGFLSLGTLIHVITDKYVLLGIVLYGFALVLWLAAMPFLDVSYMYPLLSLGYVLTAVLALVFLKEDISVIRWVGILVIVAGCFLVLRT